MSADTTLFRIRLETELKDIVEAMRRAGQSASPVELDQSSVGRVSRIDALQQQALAKGLLDRLSVRKRKLDAALNRVEAGSYGLCCGCQCDMEPQRLGSDPAAVFCSDCAAEREKR